MLFFWQQKYPFLKTTKIVHPPQGLGDILYVLLCLEAKGKEKYTFILRKKHFKDICLLFPDIVENVIVSEKFPYCEKFLYQHKDIYKEQEANCFLELFCNAVSADIKHHHDFKFDEKYKDKFIKEGFIIGKTVLICPECVSCPNEVSEQYWIKYADMLTEAGFLPVFNSEKKYGNYKNIFLNIRETVNFAELAGNIIGYRSGLCDVLCYFTNAAGIYFYPDKLQNEAKKYNKDFTIAPVQKYMEFCSLKKINPDKDIKEFIFEENKFYFFD